MGSGVTLVQGVHGPHSVHQALIEPFFVLQPKVGGRQTKMSQPHSVLSRKSLAGRQEKGQCHFRVARKLPDLEVRLGFACWRIRAWRRSLEDTSNSVFVPWLVWLSGLSTTL